MPTGHNISQGDGNSSDGDSIDARNPSSTGMGCYKNYEEAALRNTEHLSPQVCPSTYVYGFFLLLVWLSVICIERK